MPHSLRRFTAAEQTADHLREGILSGRWLGKLPGVLVLANESDVSPGTMRAAIRILEADGWIRGEGAGRARTASPPKEVTCECDRRSMRVLVLPGMRLADEDAAFQRILMLLQRDLETAGHTCRIVGKSQEEMERNFARIQRYVNRQVADAWVVVGGNEEVLSWFSSREVPVIAIGGSFSGVPIAATAMRGSPAYRAAVRRLIELGHRRIVLLWPYVHTEPSKDTHIGILREELAAVGAEFSQYHVPRWKPTPESLHETLERTFQITPPTAILATYGNWMTGVLSFLAERGLRSPRDVSLVCLNEDVWFFWRKPQIACLRGDDNQLVRRIVRWVNAATIGRQDRKLVDFPQFFVEGGTIGPAAK